MRATLHRMEIRTARPDEADTVVAALEWLFAPPGGEPRGWSADRARTTFAWLCEAETATVLLADVDGTVAGLCSVSLELRSMRFGPRAWVEDLVVDPGRRSGGVGKALLDAAKDWARDRGATHLELDSGDARTQAHRFYERERPDWTSRQFAWAL